MLLIALIETPGGESVVRLEGELIGPWVDELKALCEQRLDSHTPLSLDLADVRFADRQGVTLLHGLQARGVHLARCSLFVAEQLRA
jgi:hypothetical protein